MDLGKQFLILFQQKLEQLMLQMNQGQHNEKKGNNEE